MLRFRSLLVLLVILSTSRARAEPQPGYHAKISVTAPTRLDWTFALSNRSLATPPADWTTDYDATKQGYELFVPTRKDAKTPLPVILFVSPSNAPSGWKAFEKICKEQGFLFIGPH